MNLAERIAFALNQINENQDVVASKLGLNKNTISKYKKGKGDLKGVALEGLSIHYGFSPIWLLTGRGTPQSQEEIGDAEPGKARHAFQLQVDLLQRIIKAVENGLDERDLYLEPDKKAEVVALLYEMYADTEKEVTEKTVTRYLKLVA